MVDRRIDDTEAVLGYGESPPTNAALGLAVQHHFELKLHRVTVHGVVLRAGYR
jgi:hypothetical protein